jgi:hypothetical protein
MSLVSDSPQKTAIVHDVAELRNLLKTEFAVSHIDAPLSGLDLLPGAVIDVCGQRVLPCTQSFLEDLAASIGMPSRYAYDIDFELFQHNFHERKKVKERSIKVCVVAERAVGLAPGDYRPAPTIKVLDVLCSGVEGIGRIQKSALSDTTVEIDFLNENVVLEPVQGDVIWVGLRVSNSETGGRGLKACLWTLRKICSNGTVISDDVGTVYWDYDKRVSCDSSIAKFANDLVNLRSTHVRLRGIYASAVERALLEEDVVRLWRRIRSAGKFTAEQTDLIVGITIDERRRMATAVAARQVANEPAAESPWDLFTMHNRITAAAQTQPFALRSRLEKIGGDVLSAYSQNYATYAGAHR